jgi:hypothetical protein
MMSVIKTLRMLWSSDADMQEICDDLSLTEAQVCQMARDLDLGPRPRSPAFIPTPEQIRLMTAKIRYGWTKVEHVRRRAGIMRE